MENDAKGNGLRKFGLEPVGDVPWGTHLCQFYQTQEDLADILVPYFKAGLENNEFCMWVTAEPLNEEEARRAMKKAMPEFSEYVKRGQIEIVSYKDWYVTGGVFDSKKVLQGWVSKLEKALKNGFDGLRLTGNTFWLEKSDWSAFTDYEEAVNNVISKYRMIAVCTYSLDKCNANEIIDVIKNHQFALVKRSGKWELIESAERRKIAEDLLKTQKKYGDLYNSMTEGVAIHHVVYDHAGKPVDYIITDVNPSFERITGLSKEQSIGKRASELYGTGSPPYLDIYAEVASSGKPASFETYFPPMKKHFSISVVSSSKGKFNTIFYDTTDRKLAEDALRESQRDLNRAQAVAKTGSWRLDTRNNVLLWSDETYRMFGIPKEMPLTYEVFLSTVHPEDRKLVDKRWNEALGGGATYDIQHRIVVDDEVKWVHEKAELEFDEMGTLSGGFGTVQDITKEKEMQQRLEESAAKLEEYANQMEQLANERAERLKDAERLAAIGATAGMVGHDIRNPLQAIVGELYLAKDGLVSLPESDAKQALKENVFMIEEQVEYINKIVTDLQDFAKPLIPCKEEVHLETVVKSVLPTINIPENIQVVYSPETEPRFIADSAYIKRIVQNLVSNAVQAMPRGGKLTLQTRRENNTAILTVEDTGVGIPEEAKTRLFQPLFTTKSKGQGFGLAVCKRLVESMNGTITFESEEGKGTKFTVKLPVNHQKMLNSAAKTT